MATRNKGFICITCRWHSVFRPYRGTDVDKVDRFTSNQDQNDLQTIIHVSPNMVPFTTVSGNGLFLPTDFLKLSLGV